MAEYYVQWWNNTIGGWVISNAHKPLSKNDAIVQCAKANKDLPPLGIRRRAIEVVEIPVPTEIVVRHYYNKEGWTVLRSFPFMPDGFAKAEEFYFELVKKDPCHAHDYDVKEIF
jgi:hypothetical protein